MSRKTVEMRLPVTVVMGGKEYAPGEALSVDAKTAADLRERYKELPEPSASAPAKPRKPTGEALTRAIIEAVDTLDPDEDFTRAGLPSLTSLERVLGYAVSADERAAAVTAVEDEIIAKLPD